MVTVNQQLAKQSLQLAEGKNREAQLSTAMDTLREQVLLALEDKKTSSECVVGLQSDLAAKERELAAAEEAARKEREHLQQTLDRKVKRLVDLEAVVAANESALNASENEVVELRKQLQQAVEERSERDERVADLEEARTHLMVKVHDLETRVVTAREEGAMEAELLQERVSELQREMEVVSKREVAEKAILQEAVSRLEDQLKSSDQGDLTEELRQQISVLEESLHVARQDEAVEKLKTRVSELEVEVGSVNNDKMEVTKRLESRISVLMLEKESEHAKLQGCNLDLQRKMEELKADRGEQWSC